MITDYYGPFDLTAFPTPLKSQLRNKYIECLAFLLLKECYPFIYSDLLISDRPDLQLPDYSAGIEVTEAVLPRIAQINGEFTKLRVGKQSDSDKARCRRIIEQRGGKVEEFGISYPPQTGIEERILFQEAVRHKMRLVSSYRERGFESVGLFAVFDEIPIPFNPDDSIKWFIEAQDGYATKYDLLYFFYQCGLICYDFESNSCEIKIIGEQKYSELSKKARITVEQIS